MNRAEEDTKALLAFAQERGIHHVIVCVGYEDGSHYTGWKGTALAIRGLFEICRGVIKRTFSSEGITNSFSTTRTPTPPIIPGTGGAGPAIGYGSNGQGGAGS